MVTCLYPLRMACRGLRHGIAVLCLGWFACSVQAQALDIELVAADAQGLTLLMTAPEATLQPVPGTDSRWYLLDLPDASVKPVLGQPALPQQGVLVGIPAEARLTLTVLDAQYRDIADHAIVPSVPRQIPADIPLWQIYDQYIDRDFYARDDLLPAVPVSIGFQGQLRDQPVAQILFHPVQVNPLTDTVRVYTQLRVRVVFDRPLISPASADNNARITSVSAKRGQDPFAAMMRQSLLNASQAGH